MEFGPAVTEGDRHRPDMRLVVRGAHRFHVFAIKGGDAYIHVESGGQVLGSGPLREFPADYLASARYRLKHARDAVKPVARVATVLIGPDALGALRAAITELSVPRPAVPDPPATGAAPWPTPGR